MKQAQDDGTRGHTASHFPGGRLREVRDRIRMGFYDRPEVVRETAGRILLAGDVRRGASRRAP